MNAKEKVLYTLAVAFVLFYGWSLGKAVEDFVAIAMVWDGTIDTIAKLVFLGLIILLLTTFVLGLPDMFGTKRLYVGFKMWLLRYIDHCLP